MCAVRMKINLTKEELIKLYYDEGMTLESIGNIFECTRKPIKRLMKYYNLNIRKQGQFHSVNRLTILDNITREELKFMYIIKEMTLKEIANCFNCSIPVISNKLDSFNILRRDSKECIKNRNFSGKNNPNYKDGRSSFLSLLRSCSLYSTWRKEVFKRDNFTCQECNKASTGNIEAHHINKISNLILEFLKEYDQFSSIEDKETLLRLSTKYKPFWNLENGKTLCEKCHKLEHTKREI